MRWIVSSSVKFRLLAIFIGVSMMFFGAQQLRDMPMDAFPEFAPPRVEIQTICLGLNAAEVESLVSVPLEQSLNGLDGLHLVRSKSVPQLSSIELQFDPGTDILHARQLVAERVTSVTPSLPTWAAPPVIIPPTSTTARVVKIGVSSKTMSIQRLSTIGYWKIRARLLRIPGVANVAIWGEHLEQYHVLVDPNRMSQRGVTLQDLMDDTSDALDVGLLRFSSGATIGTGGFIETPESAIARQPRAADRHTRRPRKGRRQGQWCQCRAPRRRGQSHDRHPGALRRRGGERRPRLADDRREVSVGQHAAGHARCRHGRQGASTGPPGRHDRHPHLPRREFHQRLDRQSHARAADRSVARHPRALRVPVRMADGPDQHGRDPALADGRRPRALLARRHDQRHGAGGSGDRARRRRRRCDHRHREHLAAPAPEPRGGQQHALSQRSSSRRRSRCGARSSTRR